MKRVTMIAIRPMRYGTRRLRAGDAFDATAGDARIFQAVGMARDAPAQVVSTRMPGQAPTSATEPVLTTWDIDGLRADYEAKTGLKADRRWGVERLRAEIAVAVRAAASPQPDAADKTNDE
jgi:hypothetical protein